jgi:hypothetical protein
MQIDFESKKSAFIRVYPWLKTQCATLLLALLALPCTVSAHQLDEYLQATLVVIEPDSVRLQINLTPGVAVAERVLALIDTDRDGMISTNEAAAYCELLKRDLIVRLDQRNTKLKCTASYFPGPAELRTGWGFIQMEFSATRGSLAVGEHSFAIENRHLTSISVYLVNAAQPASSSVQIKQQLRNENQSTAEIRFAIHKAQRAFSAIGITGVTLVVLGLFCTVTLANGVRDSLRQPKTIFPAESGKPAQPFRLHHPLLSACSRMGNRLKPAQPRQSARVVHARRKAW